MEVWHGVVDVVVSMQIVEWIGVQLCGKVSVFTAIIDECSFCSCQTL